MQVWNVLHADRWKCRTQKTAKSSPSGHYRTNLSGYIFTIGKNLLNSNVSPTCPHNMVNFGPLAAETGPVVWGTPANFNGFASWQRYYTVLQQWTSANFAALNRRRHLYVAGRPSRWASAHILVFGYIFPCLVSVFEVQQGHPFGTAM